MSVRQTIIRYIHILNKLRKSPSSFKEIDQYLTLQSNFYDELFNVSKRQFQRDLKDISSIFELEIYYDFSNGVYRINEEELSEVSKRRIEAFDLFNIFKLEENIPDFIYLEKRRPLGTENLFDLFYAVKNKSIVNFTYQKFWESDSSQRTVDPLGLKEFKNRWYFIARDHKDGRIKSFALDRLTNLETTNKTFIYPANYNIEEDYRFCFGIINSTDFKPQEIILSFDPVQGKYIKSLPLHETQQILVDNSVELKIKLTVYITYDLIMEILSFGRYVKVVEPKSLVNEIEVALKKAYDQYKK